MIIISTTSKNRDSFTAHACNWENGDVLPEVSTTELTRKDLRYCLIFLSMCVCLFLSALEVSSVSTALPTITHGLRASQFVWVGSAYTLSATAFLPMSGGLAQAYGRRPCILLSIGLFALGSGICGGANSMNMLIAGRTVQGLGGGGIQSLTGIILADLVSLQQRGIYAGLFGLTSCLAFSVGPVVGGTLAAHARWRWLFYLNFPISLAAFLLVVLFLDLPTPRGNYQDKFGRMDWIGNLLIIASTVACTIGLTWGGTAAPWGSATVVIPLVLGLIGFTVFSAYEAALAEHPLVPLVLMANATSISGYVQSFCIALNTLAVIYFSPVYFRACKGLSPVLSGIYTLSLCTIAPAAILVGLSVKVTGHYRPQMWVAWVIVLVAMGLLTAAATGAMGLGLGASVGCLVLLGLGTGYVPRSLVLESALYATSVYPIQAPLSVTQNAPALAWLWFLRSFAGIWGVTIGNTVLQNGLSKALPKSFTQTAPTLYALIPELPELPAHLRSEVQAAFARSLAVLWQVLVVVCAVGAVASLFMRGLPLSNTLDAAWAIKDRDGGRDKEAATTHEMEG